jgi:hypothetical protein
MAHYLKSPASQLDYTIDWNAGYLETDRVTASTWSLTPVELNGLRIESEIQTDLRTTVMLSGGVPGHFYIITNTVSLTGGRTDSRSITLRVEQR